MENILHLAAVIRDISCAVPLAYDERFGAEIKEYIRNKLAHMSLDHRARIQRIIHEKFPLLGPDTFEKIELITKWVTEEILAYEL